MENTFIQVLNTLYKLKRSGLDEKFKPRLKTIIENACEGWGHKDTLEGYYDAWIDGEMESLVK